MQWLRRSFITGFFVTVPLIISVAAFVWVFNFIDGLTGSVLARWFGGVAIPGAGIVATALLVLLVGAAANNVFGKRLVAAFENLLQRLPVFGAVYSPVKQLLAAFSPETEGGFKRVVLAQDPSGRAVLGFLTREFTVDRGRGLERMVAVFVPTNHLYLGDVLIFPEALVSYPDISVEEGIRIFVTGGMAIAGQLGSRADLVQQPEGRPTRTAAASD
ncbi:MAG: DUF502 domain-containing protein [Vicinamibacterales bacterium]